MLIDLNRSTCKIMDLFTFLQNGRIASSFLCSAEAMGLFDYSERISNMEVFKFKAI